MSLHVNSDNFFCVNFIEYLHFLLANETFKEFDKEKKLISYFYNTKIFPCVTYKMFLLFLQQIIPTSHVSGKTMKGFLKTH